MQLLHPGILNTVPSGLLTQPPAYADVFAHYDASDGTTVTDTSGAVDQFNDKKNSNNLTATTTARPTTGTVTIGGLNAIDFDGSSDRLSTTGATDIGNGSLAFTVAFVALIGNSRAGDGVLLAYGDSASAGGMITVSQGSGSGGDELTGRFANGYVESDVAWTNGQVILGVMSLAAGQNYSNVTWHIDGSSVGITNNNTNSLNLTSTKNLVLGDYSPTGTDFFDGAIGEVVFYDKVLSQAEREQLEGYLAHKWGQEGNLPGGHPYKSSPP